MAGWGPSIACYLLLLTAVQATDLREVFYSHIRELLNTPPFAPEPKTTLVSPTEVKGWGTKLRDLLGQVTGVSVNSKNQPVIFHRGPRKWTEKSFNNSHYFMGTEGGPIQVDTIVVLDANTGEVASSWGKSMFYMPHGLTIDHHDNTWVTDVAMHQVLKFPKGGRIPSLRLGELFRPGNSDTQFCKPTSVAIATTGKIFVADGYCNSRVMKFSHEGELERIFPQNGEFLSLLVPHSIALMQAYDLLCVADRENMRVACFDAELRGQALPRAPFSPFTIHQPDLGRVFGIAAKNDLVFAVNGPTSSHIPIQGFTIDPRAEQIVDHWAPTTEGFYNPHDIAVSQDGTALYVVEIGPNKVWKFAMST